MSTLVAVLGLLAVATFVGIFQFTLSRQAASGVHRIQLSAMARLQARSAIQEMLGEISHQSNQRDTPLFRLLREVMDEAWEEKDISKLVSAPTIPRHPAWGRQAKGAAVNRAQAKIMSYEALLRGSQSSKDIQGSEEWVGVLTLRVVAEVSDAAARVRREVEENYEIRTLLLAPPRPFDQVGLFLGKHDVVLEPSKVNEARKRLLASQERIFKEIQAATLPTADAETQAKLQAIVAGLLPPEEVARRTPTMPEEPSALWGFYHTEEFFLEDLSIRKTLEEIEAKIARREAEARSSKDDAKRLVEALYQMVAEHSNGVNLIWDYLRVLNVHPFPSETFQKNVEPFLGRLTPEYFLNRAHLRIHPKDPMFLRWLAGESRMEGVIDLRGLGAPVELSGDLYGRLILIVGEQGATLRNLNLKTSLRDNRVILVSLGGDVNVDSTSHASIVMLGKEGQEKGTPGQIRIPRSTKLKGNLLIPHPTRGSLALEGSIEYDAGLIASYPPKQTLLKPDRGDYLVAISPETIFAQGRAR